MSAYKESSLEGLILGVSTGKPPELSEKKKATFLETVSPQVPADVYFMARYN